MISSEIKTTAMIAISTVLLASILNFTIYLFGVRNNLAESHNNSLSAVEAVKEQKEFNKFYENLYGVDVIATIRDYYDSGLQVVVKDAPNTTLYSVHKDTYTPNQITMDYLGGTASSNGVIPQYKADGTPYVYTAILVPFQYDPSKITRTFKGVNSDGENEYEYKYTPTGEVINMTTSNVFSIVLFTDL